jgi:uncharacterized protein YjbI with pentapeptide repeats
MANPEHVAKLKEGREAWNEWWKTTRETPNFSGITLNGLNLEHYQLGSADFSGAFLREISFPSAFSPNCSFENAILVHCTLPNMWLVDANFKNSSITATTFHLSFLDYSDFTAAKISYSIFADVSLRGVVGLEIVESQGNSIGIDTFFKSGGLPESFLRTSGVPEEFIQYAASLVGKAIEYYSCFLSYSSKDDEFARRLYNDLQGKNVRTWFAPEDLKIGDRFRARIDESIRIHDKLVIILSANSVNSDWVETEVESALEREQKEGKDVLFPIAIDEEGFTSQQPWAADIRRKRHIGDFRKWKSHDDYTAAFDRLVRDLKKSQPPIIMKGG